MYDEFQTMKAPALYATDGVSQRVRLIGGAVLCLATFTSEDEHLLTISLTIEASSRRLYSVHGTTWSSFRRLGRSSLGAGRISIRPIRLSDHGRGVAPS